MLAHRIAKVTRAEQLESFHAGVVYLARTDGRPLGIVGDAKRVIFPRSAVKVIQALPLVESGAADHFGFTSEELALACASHSGTPYHVKIAERVLARIGLDVTALACGPHAPNSDGARDDLVRAGLSPCKSHNNCSGKHAGMLATARFFGEPAEDYELAGHAVQRRIKAAMSEVTEVDLIGVIPGIDGCSVPNWPVPIDRLAVAFARIVTGEGLAPERATAFRRLIEACWQAPEAISGKGRFDTQILRRFKGDVFLKTGAEGVYCGGIRSAGIGFALKADDGAKRASQTAVGAILARFVDGAEDLAEPQIIENAAGIAVGDIRPGTELASVLERIAL